jgi:SAM-dependent methyltransferase
MNETICNLCGSQDSTIVNEGRDLGLDRETLYRLVCCDQCGLIYQEPQLTPDELHEHYPENYGRFIFEEDESGRLDRWSRQHEMNRRSDRVLRHHPVSGRLLDLGCSTGQFLDTMRRKGWEVVGVELSETAASYARESFELNVHSGTLESAQLEDKSFDVITMWDVLEHVVDPAATLREAHRLLKEDGWLIASTPNPESVEARLFGANWIGWDRPRHLYVFSQDVLKRYLTETGFSVYGFESFGGRLSILLLNLENMLKARRADQKKWLPWIRLAYNWPLRLLTWPIFRLLEAINKSTTITFFAQRINTSDADI